MPKEEFASSLGEWFRERQQEYLGRERIQKIEYKLLEAVIERGLETERGLAESLERSQGYVSKLLQRLNNEGFLRLGRKGKEQRVEVTEGGREMFSRGKRQMETMMRCWLGQVGPQERKGMLSSLRRLNEGAEEWQHDLNLVALERSGEIGNDDEPRRRGPVGQFRVGGAARVEVSSATPQAEGRNT